MNAYLRRNELPPDHNPMSQTSSYGDEIALFEADGHIRPLDKIEADLIRLAIRHYGGQMSEVARRLNIGRSTLYRKLAELGIERNV